jgi:hypothetical protein
MSTKPLAEQNHRSQPAMAREFLSEIQSVNTAIAGGWVRTFCAMMAAGSSELQDVVARRF